MSFGDVRCGECGAGMMLVDAGPESHRPEGRAYWQCTRAPACRGTHGAHPDGRPLGIPADRETNRARLAAHLVFDRLWQERLVPSRVAAYTWLQSVMRMSEDDAHFARFGIAECAKAARFARLFVEQWTPTASPIVNISADPWGLVSAGVDPDDLDEPPAYAPPIPPWGTAITDPTGSSPSCSPVDDIFCEQPGGW